jgi:hypothetical protein
MRRRWTLAILLVLVVAGLFLVWRPTRTSPIASPRNDPQTVDATRIADSTLEAVLVNDFETPCM